MRHLQIIGNLGYACIQLHNENAELTEKIINEKYKFVRCLCVCGNFSKVCETGCSRKIEGPRSEELLN